MEKEAAMWYTGFFETLSIFGPIFCFVAKRRVTKE
jgi:hypothetical protein